MSTETKITSASVRVALSHNYNSFEICLNIENENGLKQEEINEARIQAHELARTAVDQHKPITSTKNELQQIDARLREVKKLAEGIKEEPAPDPKEIAKVEALPLYKPKKK
jgi:hypothetical protein